jgi:hypothetical protein
MIVEGPFDLRSLDNSYEEIITNLDSKSIKKDVAIDDLLMVSFELDENVPRFFSKSHHEKYKNH